MKSNLAGVKGEGLGSEGLDGVYSNTHALRSLSTHIFRKSQGLQGMECGQCPGGLGPFFPRCPPPKLPTSHGREGDGGQARRLNKKLAWHSNPKF